MSHVGGGASPASVGGAGLGDAGALLESELKELVSKMQQSFTQLIHAHASVIGESVEEQQAREDEQLDAELQALFRVGGDATTAPPTWAVASGGAQRGGLADDKLSAIPARKALPVQKLSYAQMQAGALKQALQTSVHANSMVHHGHSLLGLVSRLKLSVLLAQSAQDATRRERSMRQEEDGADAAARHPLEPTVHPSSIPDHLLPLHLQRTQQQLHDTGLELYAQVCALDRQREDAQADALEADQQQPAAAR